MGDGKCDIDIDALKKIACDEIEAISKELREVSLTIWNNPELYYEEKLAHKTLTEYLESKGMEVEKHYMLDTAFRAYHNKDGSDDLPHIAVMSEYDALPEIGHGCGHNLIAILGIGAGLGMRAAMQAAGRPIGKLSVLGTPAEEEGGGKVDLLQGGALAGVSAAMMAHPGDLNATAMPDLALIEVSVTFTGKASHAAGSPWEGVNALDAAVQGYQAVSNLRQQMKPGWMIHGIITNGGAKPNIIPEEAALFYYLRAPTFCQLEQLMERVEDCFRGAALTTGCEVRLDWDPKPYHNVRSNAEMERLYEENCLSLGGWEKCTDEEKLAIPTGSTDMGNVSHVVPSIHPHYHIGDVPCHTGEFREVAGTPCAHDRTMLQAKALAMTGVDLMLRPDALQRAREAFSEQAEAERDAVTGTRVAAVAATAPDPTAEQDKT